MPTRHYTTRRDVTRQLSTRKSCGGLRHDKTKIWPCRRYLALSDHSRQGPIFFLSCIVVSFRVMCGGQKRWQRREFLMWIIRLFSRERNNNDILLRDRIGNHWWPLSKTDLHLNERVFDNVHSSRLLRLQYLFYSRTKSLLLN